MTRLKTWFKKRWDWLKKNWDYTIAPIVVVVAVVVNNWNRGWFNALEGIDIVLIVAILLFFMGYLYILLRIIPTLEFVGDRVGKRNIQVFGILLGSLVVFYLLWNLHGILPNKWVEISLLAGLVAVTSGLAVYAAAQAYASVRMAREMREQRYDTVRPVIDIQREPWDEDKIPEALDGKSGDTCRGFACVLHNIGLGPAIDMHSFVQNPFVQNHSDRRQRFEFGTLATREKTNKMNLSVKQGDGRMALLAYYKDVYERAFESSREVSFDKEKGLQLGPLKISPLPEKESKPK